MVIAIVNGPNLNLLGDRETYIYGDMTFEDYLEKLEARYKQIEFKYKQSNVEGELVSLLQERDKDSDGIILNAAAYTHTSVAIADTIAAISTPVIEVHISNIVSREGFRHTSLIAPNCSGTIFGFGIEGYALAVEAFATKIL